MKVPFATNSSHRRSYSACEPSHQTMRSGFASPAISETHWRKPGWRTQAGAFDWSVVPVAGAFIYSDSKNSKAQRGWASDGEGIRGADSSTGGLKVPPCQLARHTYYLS